jgi:hypothetical protein
MSAASPPLLVTSGAARLSGRRPVPSPASLRNCGTRRCEGTLLGALARPQRRIDPREAALRYRRFTIGRKTMRTVPVFPRGDARSNRVLASEGSVR